MNKIEKPKKKNRTQKMNETDFNLALKLLKTSKIESYKLLENKPFLRKLKEKLETV